MKLAVVTEEETHTGDTSSPPLEDNPSDDSTEISNEAATIPNATSTTHSSLPIPCNPTVPGSVNKTDQPQLTVPFLGVTLEVATPPNQ